MRRRSSVVLGFGLLAALAFGMAGCAPEYDRTLITNVRAASEGEGSVDLARVVVPVGMVVTAHIVSYNDDNKPMAMRFSTKDPRVVEVANIISDNDFAFLGLEPGVTEVELYAGEKLVLIIEALVTEQPTSS